MRYNFDLFDPDVFNYAFGKFFDNGLFNRIFDLDEDIPLRGLMKQTDTGYAVKVEVPGFDKENIKVTYNRPYLMVNAEQTDGEVVRKYSYKTFLPNIDVNAIDSSLKNGVLTLALPKKAEDQPKPIDIKVNE
jgi:HSP20 family protein